MAGNTGDGKVYIHINSIGHLVIKAETEIEQFVLKNFVDEIVVEDVILVDEKHQQTTSQVDGYIKKIVIRPADS